MCLWVGPFNMKQDPGSGDKLQTGKVTVVTGKLHWLRQAREKGNHHLTGLLSTNQHIPLNANEKEQALETLSTLPLPHSAV